MATRAWYTHYRITKSAHSGRGKVLLRPLESDTPLWLRIKPDRDRNRTRRRYLRKGKDELVERLLQAEEGYDWKHAQWLEVNHRLALALEKLAAARQRTDGSTVYPRHFSPSRIVGSSYPNRDARETSRQ